MCAGEDDEAVFDQIVVLHGKVDQRRIVAELFSMWNARLLRSSAAHYMTAASYERLDSIFTLFNIIASICVLFFASSAWIIDGIVSYIQDKDKVQDIWTAGRKFSEYAVPLCSLGAVISAAVQYVLQLSRKATEHKMAGNEFSNLRRKIERYWAKGHVHLEAIHALNRSYNAIVKNPPLVPKRFWISSYHMKLEEIQAVNQAYFGVETAFRAGQT